MTIDQPFDHNSECRFCDELGGHTAGCPWLLERLEELRQLRDRLQSFAGLDRIDLLEAEVEALRAEVERLRER